MEIRCSINTKELRLGNILNIFRPEVSGFLPVKIDEPRLIALLTGEETTYYQIPLTNEILKRCGFDVSKKMWEDRYQLFEDKDATYFLEFDWLHRDGGYSFLIDLGTELESIGVPIKYLHQLQNFYFALTGEELEIELP